MTSIRGPGHAVSSPGHVSNKSCSSKFPDGCCWGTSCNHNKNHKGRSNHEISSGGDKSGGDPPKYYGPRGVPQAFLADSITIHRLRNNTEQVDTNGLTEEVMFQPRFEGVRESTRHLGDELSWWRDSPGSGWTILLVLYKCVLSSIILGCNIPGNSTLFSSVDQRVEQPSWDPRGCSLLNLPATDPLFPLPFAPPPSPCNLASSPTILAILLISYTLFIYLWCKNGRPFYFLKILLEYSWFTTLC